jgi:hypothetical protein
LVAQNQRLEAENDHLRPISEVRGQAAGGAVGPLVVSSRPPESAELTHVPQQQEQGRLMAGGSTVSYALIVASMLLLNIVKAAKKQQKRLPIKKRRRWRTDYSTLIFSR